MMRAGGPPLLVGRTEYPMFRTKLISYLASHGLSKVTKMPCDEPPRLGGQVSDVMKLDREREISAHRLMEEKAYGVISEAVGQLPSLLKSITSHPSVTDAEYPLGSRLYARLEAEMLGTADITLQFSTEHMIQNCKQNGRSIKDFLIDIDNHFALLPTPIEYSDARKALTLIKNVDEEFVAWIAAHSDGLTWEKLCKGLQGHADTLAIRKSNSTVTPAVSSVASIASLAETVAKLSDSIGELQAHQAELLSSNFKNSKKRKSNPSLKQNQSHDYKKKKKEFKKGIICHNCKKEGHYKRDCWSKRKEVNQV